MAQMGTWSVKRVLRLAAVVGILALLVWTLLSKPVLIHTHLLSKADHRSCGAYNEEGSGLTVLNPIRSRAAERMADAFLDDASHGRFSAAMSKGVSQMLRKEYLLPVAEWRLVNRSDLDGNITLFCRLEQRTPEPKNQNACVVAMVRMRHAGTRWQISSYGLSY